MALHSHTLPIALGEVSTDSNLKGMVGVRFPNPNGKGTLVLVKASGSITADAGTALKMDGTTSWSVDAVAGAAANAGSVAGIVPDELDGESIVSGDYFLLIRNGEGPCATEGAVAQFADIATHGSAGKFDDTTVAFDTIIGHTLASTGGAGDTTALYFLP